MFVLCEEVPRGFRQPVPPGTWHWELGSVDDLLSAEEPVSFEVCEDAGIVRGDAELFACMRGGRIASAWIYARDGVSRLRAMRVEDLLAAVEVYAILHSE